MKKILFTSTLIFLLIQIISAQSESQLIEKISQEYSDSLDIYMDVEREIYEYDSRGNNTVKTIIKYDKNGDPLSWGGSLYHYNPSNQLIKETIRRYNWDVDLWITNQRIDYLYDEDGCILERKISPYLLTQDILIQYPLNNSSCLELEYESFRLQDDSLTFDKKRIYTYDEEGRITSQKTYYYIEHLDSLMLGIGLFQSFNEYDDLSTDYNYILYSSGHFFQYSNEIYEYQYEFNPTDNRIESKQKTTYEVQIPYPGSINTTPIYQDTFLLETAQIDIQYDCKAGNNIKQEDEIYDTYENYTGNIIASGKRRRLYFYQGINPCFQPNKTIEATIYPNPSDGKIEIQSTLFESGNTNIQVFDMSGKLLLQKVNFVRKEKTELDLTGLPNGVYSIQLLNGESFVSKKLVVAR